MLTLNLKFRARSMFLHKYQFYQGSFQVYLYLLRYFFNAQVLLFFKSSNFIYTRTKLTINKSPFVQTRAKTSLLEVYSNQKFFLSALISKHNDFFKSFNLKAFIFLHGFGGLNHLSKVKILYKFEKALHLVKAPLLKKGRVVNVFS
jgi:hypothetical protein